MSDTVTDMGTRAACPPTRPPERPGWSPAGWGLLAAAFAVGFVNFPLQVVGRGLDHLPGDAIDNRLNNFVLEHGYRYLTGREPSFWDAPCFYPQPRVTAWSDAHLGMLPVYAAVRAAGASPERAFQWYFLIPFVLNFAAAAWAFRRLGFGPVGTAAGAYLFAYGLPLAGQLAHAQLFPRFLVPPALLFAWEFLQRPRTWRLALAGLCVAGQITLTVYIGFFLVLVGGAWLAVAVVGFRKSLPWVELLRPGRRVWAARAAVVAACGLAVVPLLATHARGVPRNSPDLLRLFSSEPGSWLTPPGAAYLNPASPWSPLPAVAVVGGEQQMAIGLVPLVVVPLVAVSVVRRDLGGPGGFAAAGAVAAVLLAALVTRYGTVWPYEYFAALPGVSSVRVPGRVVLVLLFPTGAAVAHALDAAVAASRRSGRAAAAACATVLLAAVVADQRLVPTAGHDAEWLPYRYPVASALAAQERIATATAGHPAPTLLYVFPSAADGPGGRIGLACEAMRAAQDAGIPCVNGWSGYLPGAWGYFTTYRGLMAWLTRDNAVSPGRLAGLVVVGEPEPDADPGYEAEMRARHPPQLPPAPRSP